MLQRVLQRSPSLRLHRVMLSSSPLPRRWLVVLPSNLVSTAATTNCSMLGSQQHSSLLHHSLFLSNQQQKQQYSSSSTLALQQARYHSSCRRDILDEEDTEDPQQQQSSSHEKEDSSMPSPLSYQPPSADDTMLPWQQQHQRVWHAVTDAAAAAATTARSPTYWTKTFLETSMIETTLPSSNICSSRPTATSSLHDHDPVEFWASEDDHKTPPPVATTTTTATTTMSTTATATTPTSNSASTNAGRLRVRQLGVLDQDPVRDVQLLTENYTVPSLAIALRDREDVLQQCAELALQEDWNAICSILEPFQHQYVLERRQQHTIHHGGNNNNNNSNNNNTTPTSNSKTGGILVLDQDDSDSSSSSSTSSVMVKPLDTNALELIRKALMRMPRQVIQAHTQRAGVVLPLCHVHSVPSLLLERRAAHLSSHPNEVCLPGGMICKIHDRTIVATCLREMREEIPAMAELDITVLGVLRCNWGDLHHLVGVAVTPVVCWVGGDMEHVDLQPNPSEVSQVFTIPLHSLLDASLWRHQEGYAPVFVGGPYEIWGLTGYILERFAQDILLPHSSRAVVEAMMTTTTTNNNNKKN